MQQLFARRLLAQRNGSTYPEPREEILKLDRTNNKTHTHTHTRARAKNQQQKEQANMLLHCPNMLFQKKKDKGTSHLPLCKWTMYS